MATKDVTWQRFAFLPSLLLLVLLLNQAAGEGKRALDLCTLVLEMDALGVPRNQLARWTYLADLKSSYKYGAVSPPDSKGHRYYGLFQMSDEYWCQSIYHPNAPNICQVPCDDLLSDDISAAVKCAQLVHSREGFNPWGCNIRYPEPESIDHCFEKEELNRNTQNRTNVVDASRESRRPDTLRVEGNRLGLEAACRKPQFL